MHARVDHPHGWVGVRVADLHVRTATLGAPCGRASDGGGAEAETVGVRVVTGSMHIVTGFNT